MEKIKPSSSARHEFLKQKILKSGCQPKALSGSGRRYDLMRLVVGFIPVIFMTVSLFLVVACHLPPIKKNVSSGVYHLVKKNETIEGIAKAYGVSSYAVMGANHLRDVRAAQEGTVIFIPSASKVMDDTGRGGKAKGEDIQDKTGKSGFKDVKKYDVSKDARAVKPPGVPIAKSKNKRSYPSKQNSRSKNSIIVVHGEPATDTVHDKKSSDGSLNVQPSRLQPVSEKQKMTKTVDEQVTRTTQAEEAPDKKLPSKPEEPATLKKMSSGKNKFIWPVRGKVKFHFGAQPNKTFHNWITIVSSDGVKVKAAESGTVIFSSNLKNYGETIIIRHKSNFATVYTHLKKRYVKMDQAVKKGEAVALLGEKDDAGDVYLNFEIRLQGKAQNPLQYLP